MATVQRWTLDATGDIGKLVIYGRTENWRFFTTLEVEDELSTCVPGELKTTGPIKVKSVRRYPGDPNPYDVPANNDGYKYLYKADKRSGGALPGKTVTFSTNPATWDGGDESRAFQYVGAWKDLIQRLEASAEKDIIVHNHTGARVLICAADAGDGGGFTTR